MNQNYTIAESYTLPSKGKIYRKGKEVNPDFTIRSMTTQEEMRRMSPSGDSQYKNMSDIIEACLVKKLDIPVYDLHLGDYQYLLHRLRVVTYGPDYKLVCRCPICQKVFTHTVNLDELEVFEYSDKILEYMTVKLPQSGHEIELEFQTPRNLDRVTKRKKEILKRAPEATDPTLLLTICSMISKVDGEELSTASLENFVKKLPMKDVNVIMKKAEKLNEAIGVTTKFECECPQCSFEMESPFRITSEFFGPGID